MNTTRLPLIALALFATGAAFADDITPDNTAAALSTKTRAEVRAEFLKARAEGTLIAANEQYAPVGAAIAPAAPRALASRLATAAPRDADIARAFYGEDSGSFHMAQQAGATAAPVVAGLGLRGRR